MPYCRQVYVTVRLGAGYFVCPLCHVSQPHPPRDFFLEFYVIGYGFCPFCVEWFVIKGGDALGVAEVGDDGRLRTRLFSGRERKGRRKT